MSVKPWWGDRAPINSRAAAPHLSTRAEINTGRQVLTQVCTLFLSVRPFSLSFDRSIGAFSISLETYSNLSIADIY